MRLPRIANLDEFQPLAAEPGVRVRWIADAESLGDPDLIIVPGTKSTIDDLAWLRERRLGAAIREHRANGTPVFGICGGFQMLGTRLVDDAGVEHAGSVDGLELLPVITHFEPDKVTRRVRARLSANADLWSAPAFESDLDAYEIHMGRTTLDGSEETTVRPFIVGDGEDLHADGCATPDGLVVGTYLHGLFENDAFRRAVLAGLARRKSIELPATAPLRSIDQEFDALADVVANELDLAAIGEMVGLPIAAAR
jgi:adenosylcobyric acid synthase